MNSELSNTEVVVNEKLVHADIWTTRRGGIKTHCQEMMLEQPSERRRKGGWHHIRANISRQATLMRK